VTGNTTPTTVVTLGSTKDATNNLKNGSATINVSGGKPLYSYEWTDSSNKVVATTKDLTNVAAGTYICKITDKDGCSVLFTVVIKNTTAIQDVDNQDIVSVFPNPTNGVFYVEIKNTNMAFLSIYDLNGRIFLQENIKSNQAIPTDNFAKGIYILKVNILDKSIFRKLVVE
jgi:Secretion system C-terminal sorting domain/SprB repeat